MKSTKTKKSISPTRLGVSTLALLLALPVLAFDEKKVSDGARENYITLVEDMGVLLELQSPTIGAARKA